MRTSRPAASRVFLRSRRAAASLLCGALLSVAGTPARSAAQSPDDFTRCLTTLRGSRLARSITATTWEQHVTRLRPDSAVLVSLNAQPEFRLAIWDYFAIMVDDERIADGQRMLSEQSQTLSRIGERSSVDAATIVAIWGVESNFGTGQGGLPIVRSLATLSCLGRRQAYFRRELMAALRILQADHVEPARFTGSWAGAFGHTQFMPSTFEWAAVDFDGDGKRDVVDNAGDALASTANFLVRAGRWRAGVPWGFEVQVPSDARIVREGRAHRRSLAAWSAAGLTRVDGTPLANGLLSSRARAALLRPAGPHGPAFIALDNFFAVLRYNASTSYALAIVHLADRLRGGAALVTAWPTNDLGLSRTDRRELHGLLAARGHHVGAPTAVLTPLVVAAIRTEQTRLNVAVSGRPGQRLLAALRAPNKE